MIEIDSPWVKTAHDEACQSERDGVGRGPTVGGLRGNPDLNYGVRRVALLKMPMFCGLVQM